MGLNGIFLITTARLWNLENERSIPRVLSGHTGIISSVALTADGKWALTGSADNTARFWDVKNSDSSPRILSGHTQADTLSSSDARWEVGLNWIMGYDSTTL